MTEDTKELLCLQLSVLKKTMMEEGIVFGFAINKEDYDNSLLCFIDKESFENGDTDDYICFRLSALNKGLF